MPYKVTLKKKAIKALTKINEPYYSNIKEAIYGLSNDPRPKGCKKLKGRDAYRIRIANYRAIYEINDEILLVDVVEVGHRKDVYK
ncbi:MAG: type II toxin-antitoxin system RelE family toxin [Bacteroidota bacterium]